MSLVGQQLIHTYPLISRFNGCDLAKAREYKEGWVTVGKLGVMNYEHGHEHRGGRPQRFVKNRCLARLLDFSKETVL